MDLQGKLQRMSVLSDGINEAIDKRDWETARSLAWKIDDLCALPLAHEVLMHQTLEERKDRIRRTGEAELPRSEAKQS